MDTDVYYNGIAVSNLVDGGFIFDGGGAGNTTFTSTTRINYYFLEVLYQGVLYYGVQNRGGSKYKAGVLYCHIIR
jgi:hypothetical protein